jgi:hypothetical protein
MFNGCRTITGGAFVPTGANWPAPFNDYLFADLACGKIFALNGATATLLGTSASPGAEAVHLAFGPDSDLYYTSFAGGGEIRKIEHN